MHSRSAAVVGFLVVLASTSAAFAQTAPSLGAAQSFAVLAGSTVTNTGSSTINGDLGVSPGNAVTGFPPGIVVGGTIHAADANALAAQTAVTTAYNNLAAQPCTQDLTGQDLGGKTLTAGVYCFSAAAQLTGTLTLNAQGNGNAVFIFKIGSTLTTASGSSVLMINQGSVCNVFWQVGSSATLGTSTAFAGNILALTSITETTGASLTGRALARNGAVTLDTNTVTATCTVFVAPPVCPTITMLPAALLKGRVGVDSTQTISASGGTTPYTFTTTGPLPAGLTLSAAGVLAGTPTAAGTFPFTIRGTDGAGCFVATAYSMVILAAVAPCPTITLSPSTLPNGALVTGYTTVMAAGGGAGPYVFTVTSGAVPVGLALTSAGLFAGSPSVAGTATFTVRATDTNACFGSAAYTIVVPAALAACTTPPTITSIANQTVPVDGTVAVNFTIGGGVTPGSLTVSTTSSDPVLVPSNLMVVTNGVGGARVLTLSGGGGRTGVTTITETVTDPTASSCATSTTFLFGIGTAAVPTLPQWALMALSGLVALAGYAALRKRRETGN
ncbi:MAG TPA: IPTL-CTERM sorting domain-containing protein [Vicinamibacterales bacterium]|nr:IPTL-CTERM sorting domain-containing protein [Vicinamibacterales bacterium]